MKESGVLMPVFSLASRTGAGTFGEKTFEFIDLLKDSGASIWQILPLNPAGRGNSPYQPYSSFAGDDIYISLEELKKDGLIKSEIPSFNESARLVDYEKVRNFREPFLKEAFNNFKATEKYESFIKESWVRPYAVYTSLKKEFGTPWTEWEEKYKNYGGEALPEKIENEVQYRMFLQFEFFKQWKKVKDYANKNGVRIMGDMPFYVGLDSSDVWTQKDSFLLDEDGYPKTVAGVPPDYFSKTGQRWGNPIYDWEHMEKDGFKFWCERLKESAKLFDIIRVDHFRAFDTYWSIPSSCPTAIEGEWLEAPGYEVIEKIRKTIPQTEIVAEDLGDLRQEVLTLRDHFNLKGMKVLLFALNLNGKWAVDTMENKENLIVYTGTHDNETVEEWFNKLSPAKRRKVKSFFKRNGLKTGSISERFISYALNQKAKYVIISMPDLMKLGSEGHINTPGTVGSPNWEWRESDIKNIAYSLKKNKDKFLNR